MRSILYVTLLFLSAFWLAECQTQINQTINASWTCTGGKVASISQNQVYDVTGLTCTSNKITPNTPYITTITTTDGSTASVSANVLDIDIGNRAYAAVGKITDGLCVGALFVNILVYKETEKDCKVECGLQTSNSILDVIVISGGGCGHWNYCDGSEIDTYSPGLPYK